MRRTNGEMTKKERAFCEAYAIEQLNPTQAYLKAYDCQYSTARSAACKLIKQPHIRAYIESLQKEMFAAACISAERVGLKLAEIAFAEKEDKIYTPKEQLKALDLLQKQLGLQHQKIEAEVNNDINITIE